MLNSIKNPAQTAINDLDLFCKNLDRCEELLKKKEWGELDKIIPGKVKNKTFSLLFPFASQKYSEKVFSKVAGYVNHLFMEFEKEKVYLDESQQQQFQQRKLAAFSKLANAVALEALQFKKPSKELSNALKFMNRNVISAKYRLETEKKLGVQDKDLFLHLIADATKWKKKQPLLTRKDQLTTIDLEHLSNLACYPEFVKLLEKDAHLRDECFKWMLIYNISVDTFIEYANIQHEIKKAKISQLLGRVHIENIGGPLLKIAKNAKQIKKLTLAVYDGAFDMMDMSRMRHVSLLNPNKVIHWTQGGVRRSETVKNIFASLSNRDYVESSFSFSALGLINFHPVDGYTDGQTKTFVKPNFTKENWFDLVPANNFISDELVRSRFGDSLKEDFFFEVMASRKMKKNVALDSHGWLRFYERKDIVYTDENGLLAKKKVWYVKDIGNYAETFPKNFIDGFLNYLVNTKKRVVSLIDPNVGIPREQAAYVIFPTKEEYGKIKDRIYHIMTHFGVFQFSGKNCSKPVQRLLERVIKSVPLPNFFAIDATKTRSGNKWLDHVVKKIDESKPFWKKFFFNCLIFLMGARRGVRMQKINGKKVVLKEGPLFRRLMRRVKDSLPSIKRLFSKQANEKQVNTKENIVKFSVWNYYKNHGMLYFPGYMNDQIEKAQQQNNVDSLFFKNGQLYQGNVEEKLRWNKQEEALKLQRWREKYDSAAISTTG